MTHTFATHGMVEYTLRGHNVHIYQDENEEDDKRYNVYAVAIDNYDPEGYIYTSQREAREAAADRIRKGRG